MSNEITFNPKFDFKKKPHSKSKYVKELIKEAEAEVLLWELEYPPTKWSVLLAKMALALRGRLSLRKGVPLKERFDRKYLIDAKTGCWNWMHAKSSSGRAFYNSNKFGTALASRVSWRLYRGRIPSGKIYSKRGVKWRGKYIFGSHFIFGSA